MRLTSLQYFATDPNILGYELINEPWVGDVYGKVARDRVCFSPPTAAARADHPNLLVPGVSDVRNLQPMYTRLSKTIRANGKRTLLPLRFCLLTTSRRA